MEGNGAAASTAEALANVVVAAAPSAVNPPDEDVFASYRKRMELPVRSPAEALSSSSSAAAAAGAPSGAAGGGDAGDAGDDFLSLKKAYHYVRFTEPFAEDPCVATCKRAGKSH